MSPAATDMKDHNGRPDCRTRIRRTGKGIPREVSMEEQSVSLSQSPALVTVSGMQRGNAWNSLGPGASPSSGRAGKGEGLMDDGCLPRRTRQPGWYGGSLLTTCWVCFLSTGVCRLWLPFLFCPDVCTVLSLSFPQFCLLDITLCKWRIEWLHFPPISGDRAYWEYFVKSGMLQEAKVFWKSFPFLIIREASQKLC